MSTFTRLAAVAGAALLACSAGAIPILVGEWASSNSGDSQEIYDAQLAIEAYNSANPDLPDLAVLPLPSDANQTQAALSEFVAKTSNVSGFEQNGDEKILEWLAPADCEYYYVLTKWGQGQGSFDTALHYLLAGDTLVYNPGGTGPPNGLSHVAIWCGGTSVPDGGSTAILFGMALTTLGVLGSRFKK